VQLLEVGLILMKILILEFVLLYTVDRLSTQIISPVYGTSSSRFEDPQEERSVSSSRICTFVLALVIFSLCGCVWFILRYKTLDVYCLCAVIDDRNRCRCRYMIVKVVEA